MASSIACTSGSVGLSESKLSSTAPLDRIGGLRLKRDCVSVRRRGLGTIKAMGAKYKGTQMKEQRLTEMIEEKVVQAREVCEGDATSVECRVAWDEVEEVSKAKADLRERRIRWSISVRRMQRLISVGFMKMCRFVNSVSIV